MARILGYKEDKT
jgi:hypothetical protein